MKITTEKYFSLANRGFIIDEKLQHELENLNHPHRHIESWPIGLNYNH